MNKQKKRTIKQETCTLSCREQLSAHLEDVQLVLITEAARPNKKAHVLLVAEEGGEAARAEGQAVHGRAHSRALLGGKEGGHDFVSGSARRTSAKMRALDDKETAADYLPSCCRGASSER